MATTAVTEEIPANYGPPPDDDITDPITPPEALAPLPEPTLQQVRDDLRGLVRMLAGAMDRMPAVMTQHLDAYVAGVAPVQGSLSAPEAGALQCLIETLETLGARGVMVSGSPYVAEIKCLSPNFYPLLLRIERREGAEFFEALAKMEAWLINNHYTAPPAPTRAL